MCGFGLGFGSFFLFSRCLEIEPGALGLGCCDPGLLGFVRDLGEGAGVVWSVSRKNIKKGLPWLVL